MIADSRSIPANAELKCDLCIVGAGAAGITLALQFVESKLRVIVLESGGEKLEAEQRRGSSLKLVPRRDTALAFKGEVLRHKYESFLTQYRAFRQHPVEVGAKPVGQVIRAQRSAECRPWSKRETTSL